MVHRYINYCSNFMTNVLRPIMKLTEDCMLHKSDTKIDDVNYINQIDHEEMTVNTNLILTLTSECDIIIKFDLMDHHRINSISSTLEALPYS